MKRPQLVPATRLAVIAVLGVGPALAQDQILEGSFALPNVQPAVSGEMVVSETGPLSRHIELSYSDIHTGERVTQYEVELTQELHLLATDAGLSHLVHEHVKAAGDDGRFTTELHFPEPGRYHIYTDAAPSGLGQQVLRFELQVGENGNLDTQADTLLGSPPVDVKDGPIVSSDQGYRVTLSAPDLEAGKEGMITLAVEKDGQPASDLEPYLGVAAHAVFVRAQDLAYVHAHAMTDGPNGNGHHAETVEYHEHAHSHHPASNEPVEHEMPSGAEEANVEGDEAGMGAEGTMDHDEHAMHGAAEAVGSVSSTMAIHVTPPAAGAYALWVEFVGVGDVITVPFALEIP